MIFVAFVVKLSERIGTSNSAFVGLLVQAILFLLLILNRNPLITLLLMLTFGAANSFSVSVFTSNLQQRCAGPIKGRVSSIKSLIVSCFSIVLIPVISKLYDISIAYGLAVSCTIIFIYSLSSFILGRKFVFGKSYLTKAVIIDEA